MESIKKLNQQKCGVQSSELYARTNKCYDEDRSIEEDTEANISADGYGLSPPCEWPIKRNTWIHQRIGFSDQHSIPRSHNEMSSTINSLRSSSSKDLQGHKRLGAKVDVVYSLLGMLGSTEGRDDMSSTLLAMSNSIDSCLVMRQSGCLPLLIQLIHTPGQDQEIRERASRALHNVVLARSDEKIGRREIRVLRLLEQVRDYCQMLRTCLETERPPDDLERHPGPTIAALMKLSFDEAHRHAMCQLGGLHAVAELIEMDHAAHGTDSDDQSCITLRRYAGMALTNLTFGDGNNKALLCSFKEFMKALVSQLCSLSDDLRQVTASVLRNLSWRADSNSKQILREVGAVTGLMKASMEGRKESTLKSILSALWNLSAHCSTNKVDICAVEGALAFLVDMLSYKAPSKTLSIVENAGGILRNVSSHIAVRDDYRAIIRERGCLQVLLRQLRSPSLTVVSNACGALWNLSARCPYDQRLLWDLGAVPMLRSLVHSKHKMISMGSSAALKNLLSARPCGSNLVHLDSTARGLGLPSLPSLVARRQRALEQEIDQNLSETCDNIEPSSSPTNKDEKFSFKVESNFIDVTCLTRTYHKNHAEVSIGNQVPRSESKESVRSITSTHSDTVFEKAHRHIDLPDFNKKNQSSSLHSTINPHNQDVFELNKTLLEKKNSLRFKNSFGEKFTEDNLNTITSTISWATAASQESSLLRSPIENKLSPTDSVKSSISPTDTSKFNETGFIKPLLSPVSNDKNLFGDYAETDLDEPTNYSLRYAERNSDDEKLATEYFAGSEQDDTVKTYYTEGTPRGTSLNSSQSDLQYDKMKLPDRLPVSKNKNEYLFRSSLKKPEASIFAGISSSDNFNKLGEVKSYKASKQRIYPYIEKVNCTEQVNVTKNCNIIDNEPKIINDRQLKERELKVTKQNVESESLTGSIASDGDDDDDDDDLLAACIHIGMQNNRHGQSIRRNSLEKTLQRDNNLIRYQTTSALDQVESSDDKSDNFSKISFSNTDVCKESNTCSLEENFYHSFNSSKSDILLNDSKKKEEDSEEMIKDQSANEVSSTSYKTLTQIEVNTQKFNKYFKEENNQHLFKDQDEEYRRQRDPDAMIASLDRLTATLVQQTEAIREKDLIVMKQSNQSDTWNEESPNELSFPTISISIPLVGSYDSDCVQEDCPTQLETLAENTEIEQSMTTSRIIELEAFKLAEVVSNQFNDNELTYDIDDVKPPSVMDSFVSLTSSYLATESLNCNSTSLPPTLFNSRVPDRKKSLPIGVVAKRALGQEYNHTGSLESLLNNCSIKNVSQLENIKPPSIMDELLDSGEMDNSIISVASIMSEAVDVKNQDSSLMNKFILEKKYSGNNATNSLSEFLDNINPPSLFNEITDIDDTTLDANTDTMCSDTLCNEYQIIPDEFESEQLNNKLEDGNDTDEAATPISTEYSCSSTESTPKRQVKNILTPKQKRQLAKERYKTYTIAPESIKKDLSKSRLTPRQRRQDDPTRFQTQVVGNLPTEIPASCSSGIPMFKNIDGSRTYKKNKASKECQGTEKNSNIPQLLNKPNKVDNYQATDAIEAIENFDIKGRNIVSNLNGKQNNEAVEEDDDLNEEYTVNDLEINEFDHNKNELSPTEEILKKPRIVKPRDNSGNSEEKSEPVSPKGIRGRRKALYSSPNTRKTTPQSSPVKQINISGIGRSNTSPIVRATRATTLRKNTSTPDNNQLKLGALQKVTKTITLNKKSSIPQRKSSGSYKRHSTPSESTVGKKDQEEIPKTLERQGTFTKDEPEMENAPTVAIASPSKSKIAKPTRNLSSSNIKSKAVGKNSQYKVTQGVTEKIGSPKIPIKRFSGTEFKNPIESTYSNVLNIKKPVNSEQRVSYNANIASQNSPEISDKKLVKETASKIANLWKKVEKSQNKQQKPDSRQWITASNSTDTEKIINNLSTQRLFRSSTFEGMPKDKPDNFKSKIRKPSIHASETQEPIYRNSLDLTGVNTISEVSSKIPLKFTDTKINEKITPVVLRKKDNSGNTDPAKRLSRLGSFITVDSTETQIPVYLEKTIHTLPSSVDSPVESTLGSNSKIQEQKTTT
ncbi:uncharacterized protein LOC123270267 [Cotesia glomerata]|uniref:Adenomatous polyposis coli protein n=1 Tax=Cotesia glomerata TaxID=32391 RepID=A0AAV7IK86_COTGL|nr:uncharacterized protein LOC123270267 [Cotesia glomerata]KAH0552150.1 hypothetical protein KQX54_006231 [Cotesia glomerata]